MVENNRKISVVIPIYAYENRHVFMTTKCIEAAKSNTYVDFETIIVETGSNNFSDYADIYIYEKYRTTADISINRGFNCAKSDYVVLLTNDVIVSEGWLESLIEPFDKFIDCGASTLASNQFGHKKDNKIEEGIWGSVFMIPKKYASFDENYINSWEDSDLWMQIYSNGLKMYRNFDCVVYHSPGQTVYNDKMTQDNWESNKKYFINKWKDSNLSLYTSLVEGHVI